MIYVKLDENNKVGFRHFLPFDLEYGIGKTKEELEQTGFFVESIPQPEVIVGKAPVLYGDNITKTLWYEYINIPLTPEQLLEQKLTNINLSISDNEAVIDAFNNGVITETDVLSKYQEGKISDLSAFTLTFEGKKQAKIIKLDKDCNSEILGGFFSDVKNGNRLYGLTYDDQLNMEVLKSNIKDGFIPEGTLEYYAKGQPCEVWSNTEFMILYGQAMTYKKERIKTCKAKKALAESATTVAELELIVWTPYAVV